MVKFETVHLKGVAEINEDSYVTNKEHGIYAVIDGATGLGGLSGAMASKIIAQALWEESGGLLDRIKKGNDILGKESVIAYADPSVGVLNEMPKHQRSTCAIAAIEFIADKHQNLIKMNYAAAADCIIFLQYTNGQIRQINYDYMEIHDGKALLLEKEHWNAFLSDNENPNSWEDNKIKQVQKNIYEKIKSVLKENRTKLNTFEGYGIIDGSEEALHFLETGTIPLINVQKILLLTDGLKFHAQLKKEVTEEWVNSAELAFTFGLKYLVESILEMEENDRACYNFPRFKQHDDKAGILITL